MEESIYNKSDKELLEWELSLSASDLRSHAWYHGDIPRNLAEIILEEQGEFIVRDSSTFARTGDYVLSCKWGGVILHFLIHKEVLHPNTIYEQLGYRFENESFTTVQDLITYYVGNRDPISARSGAIISLPRTRVVPISRKHRIHQFSESLEHAEYVSLTQEAARQVVPVEALLIEKSFTPESLFQVSLNLKPPPGLLEELEDIPDAIRNLDEYRRCVSFESAKNDAEGKSSFDLSTFSSILLPMKVEEATMNPALIEEINTRILEASNRAMAFHMTFVDWKTLKQESFGDDDSPDQESPSTPLEEVSVRERRVCENMLNDSAFRWNNVIERSLTFSHFVAVSVIGAQEREKMLSKWITVAHELKTGFGNYFSFCNIMQGLLCSKLTAVDGPIDWLKLRRDYTNSAFLFETSLRQAYHGLLEGTEAYPPNTTVPNLLPVCLLLEDNSELFPLLRDSLSEDKLRLTAVHLCQFYSFSDNEDIYFRNWERVQSDINSPHDIILADICRTETQLLVLWGPQYYSDTLLERCRYFDDKY